MEFSQGPAAFFFFFFSRMLTGLKHYSIGLINFCSAHTTGIYDFALVFYFYEKGKSKRQARVSHGGSQLG